MTDAHCHVTGGDPTVRELLIGRDFVGVHPWETENLSAEDVRRKTEDLKSRLVSSDSSPVAPLLGVGEIGLDRLKSHEISPRMRELFELQLKLAFEFHRPVVLHGAKCWGQVVKAIQKCKAETSHPLTSSPSHPLTSSPSHPISFLFHGFSRSDGLIPDIVALNGYVSVGPAVLNDHAVNYRELVKKIPLDRLLLETDRTPENAAECPSVREVAAKVAELRGLSLAELEALTDRNANGFLSKVPDSLAFARSVRDNRKETEGERGMEKNMPGKKNMSGTASERTERANASESARIAER